MTAGRSRVRLPHVPVASAEHRPNICGREKSRAARVDGGKARGETAERNLALLRATVAAAARAQGAALDPGQF